MFLRLLTDSVYQQTLRLTGLVCDVTTLDKVYCMFMNTDVAKHFIFIKVATGKISFVSEYGKILHECCKYKVTVPNCA
jgi:hypothetical protein